MIKFNIYDSDTPFYPVEHHGSLVKKKSVSQLSRGSRCISKYQTSKENTSLT